MTPAEEILHGTDWSALEHAYDAAADLPDLLRGLLSGDPDVAGDVLGVLDAAVLHQGTIYSSTAPAARFVASILTDPRTSILCESALPWDERVRPLRAALIEWLGHVGESAAHSDDNPVDDPDAYRDCRLIRAELYQAVAPFVWDPDGSVRSQAVWTAGQLLRAPDLAEFRDALAESLLNAAPSVSPADRARLATILDGWGIPPRALLLDADPAVRAYAAATATLDADPDALAEVRDALREPDAVNRWFDGDHPQRSGWFLDTLTNALLRRTATFEEIEQEAMAIAFASDSYPRTSAIMTIAARTFPESTALDRFNEALRNRGQG